MNKPNNLWERVVKEGCINYDNRLAQAHYSTLFVVGASKAGKTTLVHAFLERDDEPKASLPVEYTYARRTNKYMIKDVVYIWEVEISSKNFVAELTENEGLAHVSLAVAIDLSNVQDLWRVCESIVELQEKIRAAAKAVINYAIVGTKYDQFEGLSTEKKVVICRILKHYATILEATLVFATKDDRTTMKVTKDLFSHLAFSSKFTHQLRFDLSSPIIIPKGGENKSEINYLHQTFETQFGKQPMTVPKRKMDATVDPGDDPNFADEKIDNRRKGINTGENGGALLD